MDNAVFLVMDLEVSITPEEGRLVARCDDLCISDHGATADEAMTNLKGTLARFLTSCARRRTLRSVLDRQSIAYQIIGEDPVPGGDFYVPMTLLHQRGVDAGTVAH